MKDSRKGKTDGEKELLTPNPHVDGGKGKKAIVYNTEEESIYGDTFWYSYERIIHSFKGDNLRSWP